LSHPKTSSIGVGSYVMDDLKSPAHLFEAGTRNLFTATRGYNSSFLIDV